MNTSTSIKNAARPELKIRAAAFNRRAFVKRVLTAGAAANVAGFALASARNQIQAAEVRPVSGPQRRSQAYQVRVNAALLAFRRPLVSHPTNGDEELYPNQIGSYSKAL